MPPPGRRGPPPNHRPTRSQEEALRARRRENGSGSGISPQRRIGSRPRRNSESSVADPEKPLTEEEKKARELRRQERERRHREKRDKTKPPNKKLDLIDRLDATSIFGTGCTFALTAVLHVPALTSSRSVSPRWSVRRRQSPSQQEWAPKRADAGFPKRLAQHVDWWLRAVEQAARPCYIHG